MGFTVSFRERLEDEVSSIIATETSGSRRWCTVAHKLMPRKEDDYRILWVVHELEFLQDEDRHRAGEKTRFVSCYRLAKVDGYWGNKPESEEMGPISVSCPLEFLDLAPEGETYSNTSAWWRSQVRAYHAAKRAGRPFKKEPHDQWIALRSAQQDMFAQAA